MPAAVRIGDPVSCGDNVAEGSGNVFVNGIPFSRQGDMSAGHGCFPPTALVQGSTTVAVNNVPGVHVTHQHASHTCNTTTHSGGQRAVITGSPNVFLNEGGASPPPALEGKAAVYAVLDEYVQVGVAREVAGVQHDDDQDSDQIYVSYRKAALEDAGIATPAEGEESVVETAPAPTTPPPSPIPTDCADIMAFVGKFPGTFQLSPNFTLAQLTTNTSVSNYRLISQNGLTEKQIVCNLRALCVNVLEPMKAHYGSSMIINSGFRHGVGGSQHYKGEGCDVSFSDTPGATASFNRAKEITSMFSYDQYIFEQNNSIWHHVSYKATGTQRRMILSKPRGNTFYPGLRRFA